MARRLGSDRNHIRLKDNLSGGSIIDFYYRMPTTSERTKYGNELVRREGKKLVYRHDETRRKYGLAILVGIGEGSFEVCKDGAWVPLGSDPNKPNYSPDWKEIVAKDAPDLVELMAAQVFERPAEVAAPEEPEAEPQAEEGEGDAEKN